jgi:hypothetical protein
MNETPEFEVLPPDKTPPGPSQTAPAPIKASSPVAKRRIMLALCVAVVSDFLSMWLEFVPPVQWALDVVTALVLFLILGRQWLLFPALIAEAIPGVALFPAWILVVVSIATWGHLKPAGPKS